MNLLIEQVKELQNTAIKNIVDNKLKEFENNNEWFSELCFCLLTANSKAETAINIQKEIGTNGFLNLKQEEIKEIIEKNKHRFHNNKSKYIVEARQYKDIKKLIEQKNEIDARNWLAENVKGLGYKEASHFMRNVGYKNLAILDRHILKLMFENNYINNIPKPLNKKIYFEIENKFNSIAKGLKLNSAELDLYMWYLKTGKILK
ncbi:N-glycosylase/DNA lyase [Candidatus Woesearchaeota archaeon]|nr:N-glycosylase/DNA lyase [Candidatus Woesearchaeota archaeon]